MSTPMTQIGTAYVEVKPDLSGFSRSVGRELDGAKSGLKSQMSGFAKSAAAGLAAGAAVGVGLIAKNAITAASDINESLSKNDKLFGRYAKGVEKFASSSAKSYGISKKAALEYTGVFGNLFRALGQSEKAASGNSVQLTKLAADMASFNNTSVEDALEAIRSGLVGETEPLRKFGVNMNDATLKTEALALAKKGLISQAEATAKTLSPETKAMAAQSLIMKQTSQAHGDFKDTSSSLANQQKILKARLDDASAAIGARLLPFAVKGANALHDLITSAQNGTGVFGVIKGAWDAVSGAFKGGSDTGGQLRTIVQSLIDVSQGLVTIAVAAWERFGGVITDQVMTAVKALGGVLEGLTTALRGLVEFIAGVFTGDWSRAWDGIKTMFEGVWKAITSGLEYQWETIKNVIRLGVTAIGTVIKAAAGALLDLGKWIVNRIVDGLKAYAQLWIDVAGWIKNRLVDAVKTLAGAFIDAGKWVLNRLVEGVKTVTGALGEIGGWIKNRVVEFVQREASGLVNVGTWIVNRVAEGAKTLTEGLSSVGGWIKNRVLGGLESVKDGFLGIGGSMIGWIVSGLKKGVDKLKDFLRTIIGLVNKIPGVEISVAGLAQGGQFSAAGVEGFATGGQVRRGTKLTAPMIMMGEEAPRHPEYVIPTNPAYRKRALGLYSRLGQELGVNGPRYVDGYAEGGILGTVKKAVTAPLSLITKGAGWLLDQLPNPAEVLPQWIQGLGKHVIDKVGGWIKDKFESLIPVGGSGGGGGVKSGTNALAALLARKFGLSITSGYRDPQHNAAVGGVPGSSHTKGSPGNPGAHDFVPPNSAALAYAVNVLKAKWADIHDFGSGPHLHVSWFRKGGILEAPFVGAYANGGVVPQDGYGYLHGGETVVPKGASLFDGAVFQLVMGGQVIDERIELKIVENGRRAGAMMRAGVI